jgi:hypothetical protein
VARDSNHIRLNFETQRMTSTVVTVGANVTVSLAPGSRLPSSSFLTQATGSRVLFRLPEGSPASRISVADAQGREVWGRNVAAGTRELVWNGTSASGHSLARGIYTARLTLLNAPGSGAMESRIVLAR